MFSSIFVSSSLSSKSFVTVFTWFYLAQLNSSLKSVVFPFNFKISPCNLFIGRLPVTVVKYIIVAIDSYWGPAHQINVLLPEKNTFKNAKESTSQRQVQSPFGRGWLREGRKGCKFQKFAQLFLFISHRRNSQSRGDLPLENNSYKSLCDITIIRFINKLPWFW